MNEGPAHEDEPGLDATAPLVFVVDDDPSVRNALSRLLRSVGLQVELFASASEFLDRQRQVQPNCLVLDIRLPGLSGLDLQGQLVASKISTPIIFMTAKPFRDQEMLDAVAAAIQRDKQARLVDDASAQLQASYKLLSKREREVMALVTSGLMNKHVAARLGIRDITAKIHRRNLMQKMKAKSLAELVRMAERLKIHEGSPLP